LEAHRGRRIGAGYWRLHRTQDDAPTQEDIAEQAEVLADAAEG
jgi:hypothetical protein